MSIINNPLSIKKLIPFKNSSSGILSVAHHPAVFFIHDGIDCNVDSALLEDSTDMISFSIKIVMILQTLHLEFYLSAHHPAVFFIQLGTVCGMFNVKTSGFSTSLYGYFTTVFSANS